MAFIVSLATFRCHTHATFTFPSHGLVLLHGGSGAGKTTVLDAVRWALFGTVRRVTTHGARACTVTLTVRPTPDDPDGGVTITRTTGPSRLTVREPGPPGAPWVERVNQEAQARIRQWLGVPSESVFLRTSTSLQSLAASSAATGARLLFLPPREQLAFIEDLARTTQAPALKGRLHAYKANLETRLAVLGHKEEGMDASLRALRGRFAKLATPELEAMVDTTEDPPSDRDVEDQKRKVDAEREALDTLTELERTSRAERGRRQEVERARDKAREGLLDLDAVLTESVRAAAGPEGADPSSPAFLERVVRAWQARAATAAQTCEARRADLNRLRQHQQCRALWAAVEDERRRIRDDVAARIQTVERHVVPDAEVRALEAEVAEGTDLIRQRRTQLAAYTRWVASKRRIRARHAAIQEELRGDVAAAPGEGCASGIPRRLSRTRAFVARRAGGGETPPEGHGGEAFEVVCDACLHRFTAVPPRGDAGAAAATRARYAVYHSALQALCAQSEAVRAAKCGPPRSVRALVKRVGRLRATVLTHTHNRAALEELTRKMARLDTPRGENLLSVQTVQKLRRARELAAHLGLSPDDLAAPDAMEVLMEAQTAAVVAEAAAREAATRAQRARALWGRFTDLDRALGGGTDAGSVPDRDVVDAVATQSARVVAETRTYEDMRRVVAFLDTEEELEEAQLALARVVAAKATAVAELQSALTLEALVQQARLDTIKTVMSAMNAHAAAHLARFFPDPISVVLKPEKALKKGGQSNQVHVRVSKGGHTYDSVDQLSGGERQRASLAFLLALHELLEPGPLPTGAPFPKLLLLDECLNHLDEAVNTDVFAYLRQYAEQTGSLVLVVSHEAIHGTFDAVVRLGDMDEK